MPNRETDSGPTESYWKTVTKVQWVGAGILGVVAYWMADGLIESGQVNLWGLLLVVIPAFGAGSVLNPSWARKTAKLVTDALPWTPKV